SRVPSKRQSRAQAFHGRHGHRCNDDRKENTWGEMSMKLIRRALLSRASIGAAGVIASPALLHWPANAAEFTYKFGTVLPDGHPMVIRSKEAAAKIKEESGGKLDITVYPNSVLGQDTAMMSQAI